MIFFSRFILMVLALLLCFAIWWIGPIITVGQYHPLAGFWTRVILIAIIAFWAFWWIVVRIWQWFYSRTRWIRVYRPGPFKDKHGSKENAVKTRFEDARSILRHHGILARRGFLKKLRYTLGREYLNDRPWYLVLGTEGCGKSTLVSSGAKQPLVGSDNAGGVWESGKTTQCCWWLTDDAVLIDTPGEWSNNDEISSDSEASWKLLLKQLKKKRRFPQLQGVLLVFDAQSLIDNPDSARKQLLEALHARLINLAEHFKYSIPVHLVVTGVDKISGGDVFLSTADEQERAVSVSFDPNLSGVQWQESVDKSFAQLQHGVQACVQAQFERLLNEESRLSLSAFPEAFGVLIDRLRVVTLTIFSNQNYPARSVLRGVWCGSGTVQPSVQPSITSVVDGENDRSRGTLAALFDILIKEKHLAWSANRNQQVARRRMLAKQVPSLAILGIGGAILLTSFFWENRAVSSAGAQFDESRRLAFDSINRSSADHRLLFASEQMRYILIQFSQEQTPLYNPFWTHRELVNAASDTYRKHLDSYFLPVLWEFAGNQFGLEVAENRDDVYDSLKLVQMLQSPEHIDLEFVEGWYMPHFRRLMGETRNELEERLFSFHLESLFSVPVEQIPSTSDFDDDLIRLARLRAERRPLPLRLLDRMRENPSIEKLEPVTLINAAGHSAPIYLKLESTGPSDPVVPSIYTRAGYQEIFLRNAVDLAQEFVEEERWVLGRTFYDEEDTAKARQIAAQKLADETRAVYLQEYAQYWKRFLASVRVRPLTSLQDSATVARKLMESDSVLSNLVYFAAREVSVSGQWEGDHIGLVGRTKNRLQRTRREFVSQISGERMNLGLTPEKVLEDQFRRLRKLGLQIARDKSGSGTSLAKTFKRIYSQLYQLADRPAQARANPELSREFTNLRQSIEGLPNPARNVAFGLVEVSEVQDRKRRRYAIHQEISGVGGPSCRKIENGYPLARRASEDIGVAEFASLFGNSGSLEQYFRENLSTLVNSNSNPWSIRPEGIGLVDREKVRSFEYANRIRQSFFDTSGQYGFDLRLRPIELDPLLASVDIDIDGQVFSYAHGPLTAERIEWPNSRGGHGFVRVTLVDVEGRSRTYSYDGPWAIHKFYDALTVESRSAWGREMVLRTDMGVFRFEIISSKSDSPIWTVALARFSCP